ncbi:mu-type opioid receptor-like [Antedon mediterranea]|uniref:mu-type opioid receptor-like n=1 Tax=Antedon mediterranea TaxID=105859 RepID=UPI003AF9C19C
MDDNNQTMSNDEPMDPQLLIAIRFIICGIGILANAFVLFVLIYNNIYKKTLTHLLIVQQSVIDLFACVLMLSFFTYPVPSDAGVPFCKALNLFWCVTYTSTYNLVIITMERYFAVLHPKFFRLHFHDKRGRFLLLLPYIIGFVTGMELFFYATYDENTGECAYAYDTAFWGVFFFITQYLFPVFVMMFCYVRILISLRRRQTPTRASQNVESISKSSVTNKQPRNWLRRAQRSLIYTICFVGLAFFITVTPNKIIFFVYIICACFELSDIIIIYEISIVLNTMNLSINPVIYAFTFYDFKRGMKQLKIDVLKIMGKGDDAELTQTPMSSTL